MDKALRGPIKPMRRQHAIQIRFGNEGIDVLTAAPWTTRAPPPVRPDTR
jgi:hypothetical protein